MNPYSKITDALTTMTKTPPIAAAVAAAARAPSPSFVAPYRPGNSRRGEHEELLAATLASGIISAAQGYVSPAAAVEQFHEVLAVLRKEQSHG